MPPEGGANTVYIAPMNVSYVHPNLPASPAFWVVRFVDGSELRVGTLYRKGFSSGASPSGNGYWSTLSDMLTNV